MHGVDHGFVGMKTNFAVLFSPHEAHGQAAAQFPTCGFIANSTLESCAENMKFCFRHDAFMPTWPRATSAVGRAKLLAESACVHCGRSNTHALRPTPEPEPLVPATLQTADEMDGLRENVGPQRLPRVHLLVFSMESTAQYWRSLWLELEPHMRLHLAQAFSNRAPRGRKHDFKDAERLVRRLMAEKLILSFVPNGEQRIWRSMTRMKLQLTRDRVRSQKQKECLLEEMRIKLSIVVSNLLGASGLRILHALAKGETDPQRLTQLGDERLQMHGGATGGCFDGKGAALHREML